MAEALRAASIGLLVAAAACGIDRGGPRPAPSQEASGFTLTRSQAGLAEWKLQSPKAEFDEATSKAKVTTPKIDLFKKGKEETRAEAERGEVDLKTQDLVLMGSVRVDNKADKTSLRTDELRYYSSAKEFRTDRPVEIRRPEGLMRGRGLTASHDLSVIKVHRQETTLR